MTSATNIIHYRDESSPENRGSSTHSSERQYHERRSPLDAAPFSSRPRPGSSEQPSPEIHKFHLNSAQASPTFSPHQSSSAFASINGPHVQSSNAHTAYRRDGVQILSPRTNHPMAVSTSLAYGYVPQSQRTPTSPPDHGGSNTLISNNSSTLPPLINRDHSFRATLPNRQLPLPPLREAHRDSHLPHTLASPTADHSVQRRGSGIATLLQAGEHLASHNPRSPPPIKHESSVQDANTGNREGRPP